MVGFLVEGTDVGLNVGCLVGGDVVGSGVGVPGKYEGAALGTTLG